MDPKFGIDELFPDQYTAYVKRAGCEEISQPFLSAHKCNEKGIKNV